MPLKLPEKFSERINPKGWFMSEKLDGVRCIWTGKELYTRGGTKLSIPSFFTFGFPRSPMDGELYIGRGRFKEILEFLMKGERKAEDWLKVSFVVFDAPALNVPFRKRLEVSIFFHFF